MGIPGFNGAYAGRGGMGGAGLAPPVAVGERYGRVGGTGTGPGVGAAACAGDEGGRDAMSTGGGSDARCRGAPALLEANTAAAANGTAALGRLSLGTGGGGPPPLDTDVSSKLYGGGASFGTPDTCHAPNARVTPSTSAGLACGRVLQ